MTPDDSAAGSMLGRPLPASLVRAVVETGFTHLSGPVARVEDLADVSGDELVSRWHLDVTRPPDGAGDVFVVTFRTHRLMELGVPDVSRAVGDLAPFANGFVPGPTIVPVWLLTRTRVPRGATIWRWSSGGDRTPVLVYRGLAAGWHGSKAYVPPQDFVGVRADVGDVTYPAEISPDGSHLELVAVNATQPPGFEPVRPMIWRRHVPVSAAKRVWDFTMRCTFEGIGGRVISRQGDTVTLQLDGDDSDAVLRLGARHVDIGVFEIQAPVAAITLLDGKSRELPTPR